MTRSTLASIALAMVCAPAAAQSIRGVVRDDETLEPLRGTEIIVVDSTGTRVAVREADGAGRFFIHLDGSGVYGLSTERLGYAAATRRALLVTAGDTVEIEFRLSRLPIPLDPIRVRARAPRTRLERMGFYRRRQAGIGRFVTAREIEERHPLFVSDMLQMEPSVRILSDREGDLVAAFWGGSSYATMNGNVCLPRLVLDGYMLGNKSNGKVNLFVSPSDVAGIELYPRGAGAPVQYGGIQAPCGVILIWTKQ